jgi:hypothetical protein
VSLADLLAIDTADKMPARKATHPKGWEPGVVWSPAKGGTVTTGPIETEPDPALWALIVSDFGLDSSKVTVDVDSVQIRAWDQAVGNGETARMRHYKATLRAVDQSPTDRADVDALCRQIAKRRPMPPRRTLVATDTPRSLVANLSDWQVGKGEGDGSTGTVDRILAALDNLDARVREARKLGRPFDAVHLIGLGDLVEQCSGHYAMQAYSVDLDRREQARVVRRLILAYVERIAPLVPRVVLGAVPGNHGENRNSSGKAYTTWTDNDDLAVVEQVAEILSANPDRYGHVSCVLADSLTLTLNVCGVIHSWAHGHQNRGGPGKVEDWWTKQAMGRTAVADAQILATGHYHHLRVSEATGRTWFQTPAMDPGSEWWTQQTGQSSPAGLLTYVVGEACGARGWSELAVL